MFLINRKKAWLLSAIVALGSVGTCFASDTMDKRTATFIEQVNVERSLGFINHLSGTIGSRPAATDKEYEAACYIADELEKLGMTVEVQKFQYSKFFKKCTSWNVEAIRKPSGEDPQDTDDIVYVTAHFDSVSAGPGANDNASGTGAILEIANAMKDLDIDKEIRFVAFGGEEEGLLGSKVYTKFLSQDEKARSIACFNLDMVATDYETVTELGIYTADGKENLVTEVASRVGKELTSLSSKTTSYEAEAERDKTGKLITSSASDHDSFTRVGIPAAVFINIDPNKRTSIYGSLEPYYHTAKDQIEHISSERLERSIKLAGSAIYNTVETEH